jgi:hypothetical protein
MNLLNEINLFKVTAISIRDFILFTCNEDQYKEIVKKRNVDIDANSYADIYFDERKEAYCLAIFYQGRKVIEFNEIHKEIHISIKALESEEFLTLGLRASVYLLRTLKNNYGKPVRRKLPI